MINSTATNDYQKEYQKLRSKRVAEILRSQNMSNDDFVFLDNFVKTYFPDASKALKNILNQDALKKVFQNTQYKELDAAEIVFTPKEAGKYCILVISGKIEIVEENQTNPPLKSFARGEVINPSDVQALAQPSKEVKAISTEKSEILIYEKELYESVIKEFASAANNAKIKGLAKHFSKIKKMDRSSREEFLTSYFKTEKFTKGTVIVSIKSKVEELYLIQTGKVVLCAPNDCAPAYAQTKIVFGLLGPENLFNENPLLFEKGSPYYAVCLEDTEVLSLGKANLNFVADQDSLFDLRGNCQGRQRLQSTFLERYQKMTKEEVEKSQNKLCEKGGFALKDINDVFEKFDPKSKTSHQFAKNLEKFNKTMEKPGANDFKKFNAGPLQKFSEFATPRLVSKDPNFRTLDPQRQLALLALRNEGANRRSGNVAVPKNLKDMNKDDIMKMQARLQNEEKMECQKIIEKKTISDKLNIKPPVEEDKSSLEDKKGLFNKMKMDSRQLLANFQLGVGEKKEETQEVKPTSEPTPSKADADEAGLKSVRGNLASLLGVGAGPIKPQPDIISKKRANLRNIL